MGKYIKKYNSEKNEWEVLSSPDVSVIQQLSGGSDITDTNIVVTNFNYANPGDKINLSEVLSRISDEISRLQRNVSWLAEHMCLSGGEPIPAPPFTTYSVFDRNLKIVSTDPEVKVRPDKYLNTVNSSVSGSTLELRDSEKLRNS